MKFPFFNKLNNFSKIENEINYWDMTPVEDYFVSCFGEKLNSESSGSEWRLTYVNNEYNVILVKCQKLKYGYIFSVKT